MKLRKQVLRLVLSCVAISCCCAGCDAQPNKPMKPLTKSSPKSGSEPVKPESTGETGATNSSSRSVQPNSQRPNSQRPNSPATAAERPAAPESRQGSTSGSQVEPSQREPSQRGPVNRQAQQVVAVDDLVSEEPWLSGDAAQLPMEYWEVQYFNAKRIGITRYRIEEERGGLKTRTETNMQLQRGTQTLRQSIVMETHEYANGRLRYFTETLESNNSASTTTEGRSTSNQLILDTKGPERNGRKQIEWPEGSWGPLGIHQLLLRKPMVPGEARKAKVFLPQMHQLAHVTMLAGNRETTTSPEGLLADVVPIDVLMQLEKDGLRVRMWVDAQGRIQKTIWPEGLNLSIFRVSRDVALKLKAEDEIESLQSIVKPLATSVDLNSAQQAQFVLRSVSADPHNLFSSGANQTVQPKPVYEALVTVYRTDWQNAPPTTVPQTPPGDAERNPSNLLPSNSPLIESLAKQWSGSATEPIAIAKNLLESTHQQIRLQEFTAIVRPVEAIVQSHEGNCAEQAMLLAALLRNRQIPARIASGVRQPQASNDSAVPGLSYHMWTEAWLNERWIPIDAVEGQPTNCRYLKVVDSALTDGHPYEPVLKVLRNLQQLKIEEVKTQ